MTMTGEIGKLYVGCCLAATLQNWTLTRHQEVLGTSENEFVGLVSWVDNFWSTQEPLTLGIWMGTTWWIWKRVIPETIIQRGTAISLILHGEPIAKRDF